MNIVNKKVLIIGTGISGIAAADLLAEEGAKVFLYDADTKRKVRRFFFMMQIQRSKKQKSESG